MQASSAFAPNEQWPKALNLAVHAILIGTAPQGCAVQKAELLVFVTAKIQLAHGSAATASPIPQTRDNVSM